MYEPKPYPVWFSCRLLSYLVQCKQSLKVMLHGTIRNDDFKCNTALQCWNNVVTFRTNVATMLQRCVSLKIVVANCLAQYHLLES